MKIAATSARDASLPGWSISPSPCSKPLETAHCTALQDQPDTDAASRNPVSDAGVSGSPKYRHSMVTNCSRETLPSARDPSEMPLSIDHAWALAYQSFPDPATSAPSILPKTVHSIARVIFPLGLKDVSVVPVIRPRLLTYPIASSYQADGGTSAKTADARGIDPVSGRTGSIGGEMPGAGGARTSGGAFSSGGVSGSGGVSISETGGSTGRGKGGMDSVMVALQTVQVKICNPLLA